MKTKKINIEKRRTIKSRSQKLGDKRKKKQSINLTHTMKYRVNQRRDEENGYKLGEHKAVLVHQQRLQHEPMGRDGDTSQVQASKN
jgi:hypothetical protein